MSDKEDRYVARPKKSRRVGWFRRELVWQIWDLKLNDWAPNVHCGAGWMVAFAVAESMNKRGRGL